MKLHINISTRSVYSYFVESIIRFGKIHRGTVFKFEREWKGEAEGVGGGGGSYKILRLTNV